MADVIRAAGPAFLESQPQLAHLAASEGAARHCCAAARRCSADIVMQCSRLRTSGHLLQLVPQPALPQVPDATPATAGSRRAAATCCPPATCTWSSRCRTSWRRWHCRTRRQIYGLLFRTSAETLLEIARDPKHLRRRDRLLQRAPYLEPATAASSPRPLRRAGRRPRARTTPAGSPATPPLLPAGEGAPQGIPRQVCRRTQEQLVRLTGGSSFTASLACLQEPRSLQFTG